jgi:hypothetical protein
MTEKTVRIAGASGAWGDSPMAIPQLLRAPVDYLVMDYLAEVTMSLLARAKKKSPEAGFPPDFVAYLAPHLKTIAERGIRVITNAGGINPQACKKALEDAARDAGVSLRIAVVLGDDLMPSLDALRTADVREAVSNAPLPSQLLSANAYLGALPIVEALAHGADIVVTGRCVDSALALGALMHEFGWRADDYDRLAAGSLVGHLLECGPQVTGGLFTDWERVPDWHNIGYPIAECRADGTFTVTKPQGTGGLLSVPSVAEQVLYEIGDPAAYLLPDVTADFSGVKLEQVGAQEVCVSGARGRAPTAQYKVSATFQDGWRAIALIAIVGTNAAGKAERTAHALIERARMLFRERDHRDFSATHIEVLGAEASYGRESRARDTREVVLRLVVDHQDPRALDLFARQVGAVGLSFAQGTAGLIGGRPKATPLVRLFTFFVDKSGVQAPTVVVGDDAPRVVRIPANDVGNVQASGRTEPASVAEIPAESPGDDEALEEVSLHVLAHARSGDKGNSSNIAIFCRKPEYMPFLRSVLTTKRIGEHFAEVVDGPVERFEAPGLNAFNFVLQNALAGGGMASPRIDPQGKAYGQRALEMRVSVPRSWVAALAKQHGDAAEHASGVPKH